MRPRPERQGRGAAPPGELARRTHPLPVRKRDFLEDIAAVKYVSTRGEAPVLGFSDVLLTGLAADGGLYVPQTWPKLSRETIAGFAGRPYAEVAQAVIEPFVGDDISRQDLAAMIREAYAGFRHPAVTPLVQVAPNRFVLELFHGPTLAFKDVAMQLLGRLMDHVLAARDQRATIVGATSGDTGGAAIEAFRGRERTDIFVLFPDGRVSDVQRRQMTTPTEANVHSLALAGTFDDCQSILKGMFTHAAFRDRVQLAGVNSINWARIVAQVVYYFVAGAALGATGTAVGATMLAGGAALAGARMAAGGGLAAIRAGTAMGSAASSAYQLGQATSGTSGMSGVAAGVGGMARAAGGAATNAARQVAGRATASLKQSADAGRRGAWTATGGTPTASMSEANAASAGAPANSASANTAPDWANRLRSEQAARAHRQTATQAIKDGDRPGNGANPSLNDKDD